MNDNSHIIKYVNQYIELTKEEEDYFSSLITNKSIKKRQYIIQPDFVAKNRSFVLDGAFRGYLMCTEGKEHTIAIAIENWWITDYNSYIFQQPATLFIEAIENSKIAQLSYDNEQKLLDKFPKFEKLFRILSQQSLASTQRRIMSNLSDSAEIRYEKFIRDYPKVVNRLPQYIIASYLGFTTEYLSKIRKKRVEA